MKLSDFVIDFLVDNQVNHIFEVCGGAVSHLLDSLYERQDITCISMHHEQAASFAAEGFARVSGKVGVAMATSGPGATNLITGIGSCFFDSTPVLFLTGQVNTYEFKFDKPVRQVGFQETDIVSIVKPVVKYTALVDDPKMIRFHLEKAMHLALSGRPGPVLLDIPMNVQRADIEPESLEPYRPEEADDAALGCTLTIIKKIAEAVRAARRPVILSGAGVGIGQARAELLELANLTGTPIITTLLGVDTFPHDHPAYVGMVGTYGHRYANLTVANADVLIILGARLDTRQTGTKPETFARGARIIHVDIDPAELNNKVKVEFAVCSSVKPFLRVLIDELDGYDREATADWRNCIAGYRERYPTIEPPGDFIHPNYLLEKVTRALADDAVICADVGQNQLWSAQSAYIKGDQRFLTQGGMGAMGSSLAMAIGASYARPGKTILVTTGDGGFQLNSQELETIHFRNLPVKIVLLNNSCYGMVRQFQLQYFNCRYQSTVVGYSHPDFIKVAGAYGVPARRLDAVEDIDEAIGRLLKNPKAGLLEVTIPRDVQILPKLSVDKPIEDQDPPLSKDELHDNMFVEPI